MRITIYILLLISLNFAGYIELKDGIASNTEILDTTGCQVTIRRRGNIVKIPKNKINFIVCKNDTLFYKEFICTPENAQKASNKVFKAGYNKDKINSIINKLEVNKIKLRNCKLYYCTSPINGNEFQCCWDEKMSLFKDKLKINHLNVKEISKEKLFELLSNKNDTNCVLIPFDVKFGYYNKDRILGDFSKKELFLQSGNPMIGISPFVKAVVNIKIIDLKLMSVVYNDSSEYTSTAQKLFRDEKEVLVEAKAISLENALLNSINPTRKVLSKLFGPL